MRKLLLLSLFFTHIFATEYLSINFGQVSSDRSYSVDVKRDGTITDKKTGEDVVVKTGDTYSSSYTEDFTRIDVIYGFQDGDYGNLYEIGIYTSSVVDELFITAAKTFPTFTFSKRWLNPYLKGSIGVGFTGSESSNPTSFSYSYGLGFMTLLSQDIKLRLGMDFINREWSDISHAYGDENWDDKDTNIYFGGIYHY